MTDMAVGDREFGRLEEAVRNLTERWASQDEAATSGRRALYERFEGLSRQVTGLEGVVRDVQQDVADMKPTITAYNLDMARRGGLFSLGRALWMGAIGLVGAISAVISHFLSKHP